MFEEWATPLDRCRFLTHGDRIDVGDRTLTAIRPPLFDNPTSRGLFDDRTGVFWSVDTFATNLTEPLDDSAGLSDADFADGQLLGSRLVAPWHPWLDERKFCAYVAEVEALPINVLAGCHTPAIYGPRIATAFELLRRVPTAEPWIEFTQADLEQWMAAMPAPEPS